MPAARHASTILQGKFRNQKIPLPAQLHGHAHITPQKVKEAAFQLIQNREKNNEKIVFWDLFAGSGQMACEAVSRSFLHVVFCERDSKRIAAIHQWLQSHAVNQEQAKALRIDAYKAIGRAFLLPLPLAEEKQPTEKILVIYADPPYTIGGQANHAFWKLAQDYKNWQQQSLYHRSFLMVQAPSSLQKKSLREQPNTKQEDFSSIYDNIYTYNNNMLLTIG